MTGNTKSIGMLHELNLKVSQGHLELWDNRPSSLVSPVLLARYLNKRELIDSHLARFNMINTYGHCLTTLVHWSAVIGERRKKSLEEGVSILIISCMDHC